MIVVDASLVFELCVNFEGGDAGRARLPSDEPVVAPEILILEFTQTLRRYVRKGQLNDAQAKIAFVNFDDLGITLFSHRELRDRIWAMRENLTAYDAAYFALAEYVDAPLWTRDTKFARAPIRSVDVRVV